MSISLRIAAAVEEARRDLHVDELHKKYLAILDSMSEYLDTAENIQAWMKAERDAKDAYDAAVFEAYCVGKRLEHELVGSPESL